MTCVVGYRRAITSTTMEKPEKRLIPCSRAMGMIKRSGGNRKIATTKGDENETRLSFTYTFALFYNRLLEMLINILVFASIE